MFITVFIGTRRINKIQTLKCDPKGIVEGPGSNRVFPLVRLFLLKKILDRCQGRKFERPAPKKEDYRHQQNNFPQEEDLR
ncbi:hypothetical protein NPIL_509821 [Nephila pilipes]|uniref:Uncharacterized protein n=1 Tax=Nephila pilipes TaxID=299642 RepID=A0A8X6UIX2_NEPPI|nr:hypothetical protein NPIL_509821 [Nephila pilipes]